MTPVTMSLQSPPLGTEARRFFLACSEDEMADAPWYESVPEVAALCGWLVAERGWEAAQICYVLDRPMRYETTRDVMLAMKSANPQVVCCDCGKLVTLDPKDHDLVDEINGTVDLPPCECGDCSWQF